MIIEDKLMKYVLFKRRTISEVRKKCESLKYDSILIEEIISYLCENDYLNDDLYIQKYLSNVMRLKNVSINEIKMDLVRRGIDSNLIEKYIDETLEDFEENSAMILAQKKIKSMDKEKIRKYLLNKGFSYNNVAKAIDNLEFIDDN